MLLANPNTILTEMFQSTYQVVVLENKQLGGKLAVKIFPKGRGKAK